MDKDTTIIVMMLLAAFCWWIKLQITEELNLAKENKRQEKDRIKRAERLKKLVNKQ